jgi:hypothetical protein
VGRVSLPLYAQHAEGITHPSRSLQPQRAPRAGLASRRPTLSPRQSRPLFVVDHRTWRKWERKGGGIRQGCQRRRRACEKKGASSEKGRARAATRTARRTSDDEHVELLPGAQARELLLARGSGAASVRPRLVREWSVGHTELDGRIRRRPGRRPGRRTSQQQAAREGRHAHVGVVCSKRFPPVVAPSATRSLRGGIMKFARFLAWGRRTTCKRAFVWSVVILFAFVGKKSFNSIHKCPSPHTRAHTALVCPARRLEHGSLRRAPRARRLPRAPRGGLHGGAYASTFQPFRFLARSQLLFFLVSHAFFLLTRPSPPPLLACTDDHHGMRVRGRGGAGRRQPHVHGQLHRQPRVG